MTGNHGLHLAENMEELQTLKARMQTAIALAERKHHLSRGHNRFMGV